MGYVLGLEFDGGSKDGQMYDLENVRLEYIRKLILIKVADVWAFLINFNFVIS